MQTYVDVNIMCGTCINDRFWRKRTVLMYKYMLAI